LNQTPKDKLDLTRLRARLVEKPRTKAGQVRQAWPDIKALFDAGHSLKDIWMWLKEIGIEIGYARLSHYTGQLKRRDQTAARAQSIAAGPEDGCISEHSPSLLNGGAGEKSAVPEEVAPPPNDPLANIREREVRRPGFQYNSDPDVKKLI
jgi:hypothetical protein